MNFNLIDFKLEHAYSLAFYANNIKIANNLRNTFPHPYFYEDACKFIKSQDSFTKAIEIEGEVVGSISINQKDDVNCKNAELGYWIGEPFWNNGVMTEAINQMVIMAFNELNIIKIYAEPFEGNVASCRVLEKSGFKLEAILKNNIFKNNEIKDSYVYSIFKGDLNGKNK